MADRTETAVTKIDPGFLVQHVETDDSLDTMEQYRILPRLKIIQAMSDGGIKDQFGEGAAIIRPGDSIVCADSESFLFNPHFFYVEWSKWSDLRDKENPMVLLRSFDPDSEVAKKASDPDQRFEIYEGDEGKDKPKKYRYVQHFRFPGVIHGDHILSGTNVVLSFERGEFFQGSNFISAIKLRKFEADGKRLPVPLWAQVWELHVSLRERGGYKWYGFDFQPPEEAAPMISSEEADEARASYESLKEAHAKRVLVTEEPDPDDVGEPGNSGEF